MSDQPPSPTEPRPTVFKERYELHRRLARGGMSDVFLARDLLLDRPVAVKVLFPEYAKDPTFVERFRREAQAAARLTHGNIVAIYDWGEELGTYFIAMEYVDGRSLSEVIRAEGQLPARQTAELVADVAAALGFAHRNGVVHRDVKPGNVLLSGNEHVKVADFGIAQALTGGDQVNLTQTGAVMGTATYFSPEQAQGKAVDARSDLYSLGCVLYEMLVTKPPFSGDSPVAVAYKHVQEQPVPPSALGIDVPAPLEAITMKLLQKQPENRYATAEDLRADLRRYLEGQPVLAMGEAVADPTTAVPATGPPTTAMPIATGGGAPYPPPDAYDDERRGRSGWLVAITVLGLAVLAAVLFLVGSNLSSSGAEKLPVPTVVELPVEEAVAELEANGFEVDRVDEVNAEKPQGIVFDQDPSGGTRADEGSTVTIKVSAGVGQAEVPDVVGMTEIQARSLLENEGFNADTSPQSSDTVPEGDVISQDPAGGQQADRGSTVQLVVSSGEEQVTVPDVRGQTETTAANELGRRGFSVSTRRAFSDTVNAGLVISTDPEPGDEVSPGSTVTLVVSEGPEPTTTTTTASTTTTTTTPSTTTTTTPSTTSSSTSSSSTTSSSVPSP